MSKKKFTGSFLEQTRKRSAASSVEISTKRRKMDHLYQSIIANMVSVLLVKYSDHMINKVQQCAALGQNKCRVFIFEDCDGVVPGTNLMNMIISDFIKALTSDPKLFKGFTIKAEKICYPLESTPIASVRGIPTLSPKYFMDVIWGAEEPEITGLEMYKTGQVRIAVPTIIVDSSNETTIEEGAYTLASLAQEPVLTTSLNEGSSSETNVVHFQNLQ